MSVVRRAAAAALMCAAAATSGLGLSACGASGAIPDMSSRPGNLPPEPLESLVPKAERIVTGHVEDAGGNVLVLVVDEALSGPVVHGERIQIADSPNGARMHAVEVGESGVWVLAAGDPAPVLTGGKFGPSRRAVERVMAGLPAAESPPDDQTLNELAAESDVVVWAEVMSTDGDTANAQRLKVLKGSIPEEFTVTAGGPDGSVGGPWKFPVQDTPERPVLFLKQSGSNWIAINPTDVTSYTPRLVERALAYQPGR